MRDFLNGILQFIMAETLTDLEFSTVESTLPLYDQSTYDDLSRILSRRESVSILQDRLIAFYHARGVEISPAKVGKSNIYIGSVLE